MSLRDAQSLRDCASEAEQGIKDLPGIGEEEIKQGNGRQAGRAASLRSGSGCVNSVRAPPLELTPMTFIRSLNSAAFLPIIGLFYACAPAATNTSIATAPATVAMTPVVPATQTTPVPPTGIHWFRNSAEMRGIYLEVYHAAGEQLEKLAAQNAPQTWAVILDADETILDNSLYNKRQDDLKAPYSDSTWRTYVYTASAPVLPGALGFTRRVHQLGGRVVVVTNRENILCEATRANIRKDSVEADLVLCRTSTGDKNPRFLSVINGTASPSLPPLKVLMWIGDNIQDFPNLTQSLRDGPELDYAEFGTIYFLLPNPMYGSWERVPYR